MKSYQGIPKPKPDGSRIEKFRNLWTAPYQSQNFLKSWTNLDQKSGSRIPTLTGATTSGYYTEKGVAYYIIIRKNGASYGSHGSNDRIFTVLVSLTMSTIC